MYRDNRSDGLITAGIGNMLPTVEAAMKLPFMFHGAPATDDMIATAYEKVHAMKPRRSTREPTDCIRLSCGGSRHAVVSDRAL